MLNILDEKIYYNGMLLFDICPDSYEFILKYNLTPKYILVKDSIASEIFHVVKNDDNTYDFDMKFNQETTKFEPIEYCKNIELQPFHQKLLFYGVPMLKIQHDKEIISLIHRF